MKIKIVDAGLGAYGCNGLTGVITKAIATNGVSSDTPGYNVRLDNGEIWRIRQSAKVKILENEDRVTVYSMIDRLNYLLDRRVKDTQTGLIGKVSGFAYYTNNVDPMVFVNALDTTGRPITEWVNVKNIKEV